MAQAQAEAVYEDFPATFAAGTHAPERLWLVGQTSFAEAPANSRRYRFVKRAIDVLGALVMTIVFAIPGFFIAAAILLTSRGPIFYHEMRLGRDGRPFRIWKFRSMHPNGSRRALIANRESAARVFEWRMHKHRLDPRITPIGGFLRRWSLDELPQLFNVLRGEMSLIGPRPIVRAEAKFYGDLLSFYLAVTPGLSGLWQVSGRSRVGYQERARLDALYVRSRSLSTDIKILFRTIPAVLGRVGAR
jgi:lipopolysaccharide/colanic/teichoic acid biosynthesis glycosyltransferase